MALPDHLKALAARVSNRGRWGTGDERGTLNFIDAAATPEVEIGYLKTIEKTYAAARGPRHYVLGNHCVYTLTKEEFVKVVRDGRLDKGMQSFGTSQQVMDNIDHLYAYLKGRSDGAITRAKVEPIQK